MPRKLLMLLLVIALLYEAGLTGVVLFAPNMAMQQMHIAPSPDTDFLGFLVGWFCLFVTAVCALALVQVYKQRTGYATLCYLLGFWWIGIGLGIYFVFQRPDNLLTDSLKGLLLVGLTFWTMRKQRA